MASGTTWWSVPASDAETPPYRVGVANDGTFASCTCKGYNYRHKCRHSEAGLSGHLEIMGGIKLTAVSDREALYEQRQAEIDRLIKARGGKWWILPDEVDDLYG